MRNDAVTNTSGKSYLFLGFFLGVAVMFLPASAYGIPRSDDAIKDYQNALVIAKQDMNRALLYSKEALKKVNPRTQPLLNAQINKLLGDLYSRKNNLQPAINYYLISAKVFDKLGNKKSLCQVYQQLGEVYYRNNYNLATALNYYNKALELAVELNNESLAAEIYNRLGSVFYNQKNYKQAALYFENALNIWKKQHNMVGIARAYNNIGEIARANRAFESALLYYEKSMEINKKQNNRFQLAVNYENIGLVNSATGDLSEALHNLRKAEQLFDRLNEKAKRLEVLLEEADVYLKEHKYHDATRIYRRVYTTAGQQGERILTKDAARGLSQALEKVKQPSEALHYYKLYSRIKDSINNERQKATISEMEARFLTSLKEKEISLKDKEIALLKSDKRIHNLELILMIAGLLAVIVVSFFWATHYKSLLRKERQLSIKNSELHRAHRELMELEIKKKDTDLANFALHIVEKNNFLKMINKELKALNKAPEEQKIVKINNLIFTVQQNMQIQKELEEFRNKVDKTYEGFFKRLKEKLPYITKNEERLCALLRLNLSSKEIAALNNTSVKAVEMSRYRLRKKCNLNNNENLCDFLEKI